MAQSRNTNATIVSDKSQKLVSFFVRIRVSFIEGDPASLLILLGVSRLTAGTQSADYSAAIRKRQPTSSIDQKMSQQSCKNNKGANKAPLE
jgi:hypothetical protein